MLINKGAKQNEKTMYGDFSCSVYDIKLVASNGFCTENGVAINETNFPDACSGRKLRNMIKITMAF